MLIKQYKKTGNARTVTLLAKHASMQLLVERVHQAIFWGQLNVYNVLLKN